MNISIRIFLVMLFLVTISNVFAQTCTSIFPNGLQAHGVNGNVNFSYHSQITNGTANISAKTITDNSNWLACSGASCAATGVPSTSSSPTFLVSSGANGNISVGYQATLNRTAGNYTTVTVGQQGTLNFTTASGVYRTQTFTTDYQSIVNFQSGDYWVNGNLTVGQATALRRVATTGVTRIFVNGNISFGFQAETQNFASNQLLIYATGNISFANEVDLSAYVYAGGTVTMGYRSTVAGAVAGSSVNLNGNEVSINYQGSNLTSVNFSPFCSGGTVAPVLLGAWNMDERLWNGTANEVLDSSGNNNHGRARIAAGSTSLPTTSSGNPAYTSGNQSTCYYGEFDKTTSPARTYSYVELTGLPALPQGFTFAAWIRSSNASAQHQRILVRDDAQNGWGFSLSDGTNQPKLRFFNRNITNTGAVTGQGSNPNCGVFCIDTDAVISSNAWHYVAAVVDTTAKTVTLYVYNQSRTLLAKTTATYAGTWQDGTGLATIGGESSASGEGTQTSWHFLGNIDEVKIYSGAVSQTTLETLMQTVRTCAGPDHYELQLSANSIACEGAAVTVRACANSMVPCTKDLSVNNSVNLSTTNGNLSATTLTLSAGEGTAYLLHPSATENQSVTVALSNEQVAAINSRKCCTGSSNCTVANSCSTVFKRAGFIFSGAQATNIDIPNQVAGTTNNTYLKAVTTDQTSGACVARLTSPQIVQMAYKCRNPVTCIAGQTLTANSSPVQANANTILTSSLSYSNVNLNFDASGRATLPINYSDVGQIQLFARLSLPASSSNPAYDLTGISNDFVVTPNSISVMGAQSLSGSANPGTTSSGSGFVAAGEKFRVTLQALNSLGNRTPNFGNEVDSVLTSSANSLGIRESSLLYPASGTTAPLVIGSPFSVGTLAGTYVNSDVYWSEVGSLSIIPFLSANHYLGANLPSNTFSVSATIGRFYPHHFSLVSSAVNNTCGSFTYMQHNTLAASFQLEARNIFDVVTTNYGANYAIGNKPSINYVAENANAGDGTSLSSRALLGTANVWTSGVLNYSTNSGSFLRTSALDGPYPQLQLGLQLQDTFDSRPLANLNMNSTTVGSCTASANCNAMSIGSSLNMLFGRLRLEDAFGPETADLPVNFTTEYWTGTFWLKNVFDSCTVINRSAITYPQGSIATDINRNVSLSGGSTQGQYKSLMPTQILFTLGDAGQYFTAPVTGTGSFNLGVDLTAYPWLRFDWNQNANHNDDTALPNANIGFGSYRGHDRIIYWREVF
jgi:Concanavalin A-like lectin/glucanases superfamily